MRWLVRIVRWLIRIIRWLMGIKLKLGYSVRLGSVFLERPTVTKYHHINHSNLTVRQDDLADNYNSASKMVPVFPVLLLKIF